MLSLNLEALGEMAKQGVGVLFGLLILFISVKMAQQNRADRNGHVLRLEGILRERKTDRDVLLAVLTKIEMHMARSDAFTAFAREAVRTTTDATTPQRRVMDRLLTDAMAQTQTPDRTYPPDPLQPSHPLQRQMERYAPPDDHDDLVPRD